MKGRTVICWIVAIATVMAVSLISIQAQAALVYGTLANFNLYNFTNQNVNDLDLILRGNGLECRHIRSYYLGWGTESGKPRGGCQDLGGGRIRITWSDTNNPIRPGNYEHFGVRFERNEPTVRAEQAIWTDNGVQVGRVSFIIQTWEGTADGIDGMVRDIIWPPDSTPRPPDPGPPWTIERAWAWTPAVIPLDSLTRNNSMVTSLNWADSVFEILSGDPNIGLELWTDPLPQQGAVIVQYSVYSEQELLAVFTNEAVLDPPPEPTSTQWGLILLILGVAGFFGYVILRRRRLGTAS